MAPKKKAIKQIAPRLRYAGKRQSWGGGLPPSVKIGIKSIARAEGKSVSWVLEQVVIDYFALSAPIYLGNVTIDRRMGRRAYQRKAEKE